MSGSSVSPSQGYQVVPEEEDEATGHGRKNHRRSTLDHGGSPTLLSRSNSRGTYNRILNMDTIEQDHNAADDNDDETNSLVLSETASPSARDPRNIFRDGKPNEAVGVEMSASISRTPSALSSTSKTPSMLLLHSHYTEDIAVSNHTTTPSGGGLLSRQGSRGASSAASSVADDWDDDNDDDDEVNIRRYHLDYTIGRGFQSPAAGRSSPRGNGTDPSFPPSSEPGHRLCDRIRYTLQQIGQHWQSLRHAARQRRAARLLMMPSESLRYKFRACVISWCCDATDMGIALTASCVAAWIFIGLVSQHTMLYWILGLVLFVIRISARRAYELCWSCVASNLAQRRQNRSRLGSRQRLGSVDDDQHSMMVITNHHHVSNSGNDNSHLPSPV